MEMEIRSFWRVFRTSVIVFDFRTNYGKSVLVGSSANPPAPWLTSLELVCVALIHQPNQHILEVGHQVVLGLAVSDAGQRSLHVIPGQN